MEKNDLNAPGATRRSVLVGSGVAITALAGTHAMAAVSANTHPSVAEPVAGPYPVPPEGRTAGPILPNRGSSLAGKVAVVTGAARGIGRAIAVEFAANGADVGFSRACALSDGLLGAQLGNLVGSRSV